LVHNKQQAIIHSTRPNESVRARDRISTWEFDDVLSALSREYIASGEPVTVNFRELVPVPPGGDRATHLIHPYPAKLLPNIPLFFANCSQLSSPGDLILDPFCGTGTVLLESVLAGRRAAGADANPLARLISQVKVRPLKRSQLERAVEAAVNAARHASPTPFSPVVDVERWYSRKTVQALGKLLTAVNATRDTSVRAFLQVCFSSCVKRASFADPRLSVPVRLKPEELSEGLSAPEVRELFSRVAGANTERLSRLGQMLPAPLAPVEIAADARHLVRPMDDRAQLIVTSPPYSSAQKYIRASSLSLGWLGLAPGHQLRPLERQNIGREHFAKSEYRQPPLVIVPAAQAAIDQIWEQNPLRAHITATYLSEMQAALAATVRCLKPGGYFVLVIGDNTICGQPFSTGQYISTLLEATGLEKKLELVDHIRSRGLMTKRNKTAGLISQEHIHVFQLPAGVQ
jgi:DNA modification methylase